MEFSELPLSLAAPFIERWHYSGRVPTGGNRFFGVRFLDIENSFTSTMDMFGGGLYCVANYGIGINPYQADFIARETGRSLSVDGLVELKRLCRVEPRRDDFPLTKFLSRCHKVLRCSGIRCVVSFSDPDEGHSGGIYRAASFEHLGKTNAEFHLVDKNGVRRHRRFAYRHARRNGITIGESREVLGLTRVKTAPKDRWGKWL